MDQSVRVGAYFLDGGYGCAQPSRSLMELEPLKQQIQSHLHSCGLSSKKLAVFLPNDADSIAFQTCRDLGLVCEQKHVDLVAELIKDARGLEPLQKRLRGDDSMDPMHVGLLHERCSTLYPKTLGCDTLEPLLDECSSRPSRRRSIPNENAEERQKKEFEQKETWSRELFKELKRIGAPALLHLEHCVDQKHLHLALAGRTRHNTLKRYIKTWRSFLQWLTAVRGSAASPEIGDLVEYLFTRFEEPCGATVPPLIVKAVVWFERIADIDPRERIGDSQVVCSVRDYLVEMLSKDRPPTQRAPRYPLVMMEAFEHVVEDEDQRIGFRLVAWVKLVKLWATLRWDDVQKIIPKELKFYGGRMTTLLRTTKTTGPSKRVQELPVCVSEHAFISNPLWLKTGFDLIKKHAPFERDYLLPKLNDEWSAFRKTMASYNDISAYSARVRRRLKRPGRDDLIIHPVLAPFWTEHSERATLPTGLALLRAQREERDMLGRWKPDGSDTYVRMYNGVIARLQLQFAKTARSPERHKTMDERDIVESAMSWISERCENLPEEGVDRILQHFEESLASPMLADWTEVGDAEQMETMHEETETGMAATLCKTANSNDVSKEKREPSFVVVNNGKKCKRLHKSRGGCWMGREMNFKSATEYFTMPEAGEYTHYCKVCWPKAGPSKADSDSSSSSSTSSSRSASSSSGQSSE